MPSPPPSSDHFSAVLVGSFNPKIYHPEWFFRQQMIRFSELEDAQVDVVTNDVTQVRFAEIAVEVVQERLAVVTKDASKLAFLQDLMTTLLTKLPHTPIRGCGLNAAHHYDLNGDFDYWHKIGHTLAPKEEVWLDVMEKPGLESLVIKGVRNGQFAGYTNITVQPSNVIKPGPGVFIQSNYHFGPEKGSVDVKDVKEFVAQEWVTAFGSAQKAADAIFKAIPRHA